MKKVLAVLTVLLIGCGGSPTAPKQQVPPPPAPGAAPNTSLAILGTWNGTCGIWGNCSLQIPTYDSTAQYPYPNVTFIMGNVPVSAVGVLRSGGYTFGGPSTQVSLNASLSIGFTDSTATVLTGNLTVTYNGGQPANYNVTFTH